MRILLLCSAFNGLSQAVWLRLRELGHDVEVHVTSDGEMTAAVAREGPDLIVCPFLRDRVPEDVWRHHPTVIIHPGPVGDRGPSSLDWAIAEGHRRWGVTALQAIEEMDAGPVWGTRTFDLPATPVRKSDLYNGPVTTAAVDLAEEVVRKAADPWFAPLRLDQAGAFATGRLRPMMRQVDRTFSWEDPTCDILRRIRAADGSPGVRTDLAGRDVRVYDAHPGPDSDHPPGRIVARRHGAVLVGTGDGTIWIGHVKTVDGPAERRIKLPATLALSDQLDGVPTVGGSPHRPPTIPHRREISYQRDGDIGVVTADLLNGAMSTTQCRRLTAALRHARRQDTRAIVVQGGATFSNGIHLSVIEAADDPAREAWDNIRAIDDVCLEILSCQDQLVVTAVGGNAGAGGVMLALAADHVLLRDGVVLNPHYATMGLFGSEYWTAMLPARVGWDTATTLTEACLPISARDAAEMEVADDLLTDDSREDFDRHVLDRVRALAATRDAVSAARERRPDFSTLAASRSHELREMALDIFGDRRGFAAARHAFVHDEPRG